MLLEPATFSDVDDRLLAKIKHKHCKNNTIMKKVGIIVVFLRLLRFLKPELIFFFLETQ